MAMPPDYDTAKKYFQDALGFLKVYHWVYRYPNTHILVNKVLEQIPGEWLSYLEKLTNEERGGIGGGVFVGSPPSSLREFFQKITNLKLNLIHHKSTSEDVIFPNNSGLREKKKHEILSLAPLIKEISDESGCDYIVDVGTGLGYLPELLHEKYNYPVLAIEGSVDKVRSARRRQLKHPESLTTVKYVHHYVTNESDKDIRRMVNEIPMKCACITGLHACADLSVTILELFTKLEFAKSLVIMPCCYHRLRQNEHGFDNFPSSTLLRTLPQFLEVREYLKIPFLRLACQGSGFEKMSEKEHEEHAISCLFRATLQQVAEEGKCQVKRLKRKSGKLKQSSPISDPFEAYLTNLKHTHSLIGGSISDDDFLRKMREKWNEHKGSVRLIEFLAALQAALQSICENVVLLDRVMFLMEKGVKCFVVKVTDQGISPRCHALVATKP